MGHGHSYLVTLFRLVQSIVVNRFHVGRSVYFDSFGLLVDNVLTFLIIMGLGGIPLTADY